MRLEGNRFAVIAMLVVLSLTSVLARLDIRKYRRLA